MVPVQTASVCCAIQQSVPGSLVCANVMARVPTTAAAAVPSLLIRFRCLTTCWSRLPLLETIKFIRSEWMGKQASCQAIVFNLSHQSGRLDEEGEGEEEDKDMDVFLSGNIESKWRL